VWHSVSNFNICEQGVLDFDCLCMLYHVWFIKELIDSKILHKSCLITDFSAKYHIFWFCSHQQGILSTLKWDLELRSLNIIHIQSNLYKSWCHYNISTYTVVNICCIFSKWREAAVVTILKSIKLDDYQVLKREQIYHRQRKYNLDRKIIT